MLRNGLALLHLLAITLLLAACSQAQITFPEQAETQTSSDQSTPTAVPQDAPDTNPETPAVSVEPAPVPTVGTRPDSPTVIQYNLGEVAVSQTAAGDQGGKLPLLPLRLNGLIGVPGGSGAHPIVLIIHDSHPGCPGDAASGEAIWPCNEEAEQPNYQGFEYLVRELAAQGYLTLAVNVNAEYSPALGEARPGSRLDTIIDWHLMKVVEAGQGGKNDFGVDLYGRVDPRRLIWIGHGQGGALAAQIINERQLAEGQGAVYGPVLGLLQIAPTASSAAQTDPPDLPIDLLLAGCDGQDLSLSGHRVFEAAREDGNPSSGRERQAPAASVLLQWANHNDFNAVAIPDMGASQIRPECRLGNLPPPDQPRAFLAAYAAAFADWLAGSGQVKADGAARKGLDPAAPLPEQLFNQQVLYAILPAAENETLLLRPYSDRELSQNLLGGSVTPNNVTLTYCPPGAAANESQTGGDFCSRRSANPLGDPAQLLVRWDRPDAALFLNLPQGGYDLTNHAALQLRAAIDPLSPLNSAGEDLAIRVSLVDQWGNMATALQNPAALAFPSGELLPDAGDGESQFSGHILMSAIRFPLADFEGLDLSAVTEVGLHFDDAGSGSLFLSDLAFVRQEHFPGAYSTLLINDGSLDHLRGIGRFQGTSPCTGALLDTGAPDAPAVIITNGHCAQQWTDTGVNVDLPAAGMQMIFNYFANTHPVQIPVPAARVLYSTMEGRDIALVELSATLGELQTRDIFPFSLAEEAPFSAEKVTVLGAPVGDLPPAETYLRQEDCDISGRASIQEFQWQFDGVYRLSCQDIYGGSSGSPLFLEGGEEIFALINTTTIGGQTPCDLNAPCEITVTGPQYRFNTSYATPVDGIGRCFNADGRFDLARPDCPLQDGVR
jgi:hypothetical protein